MADDGSWFPAVPDEVMAKALRQHASNAQEAPLLVPTQIWLGDHEPLSEPTKIDPVAMVDQWFSDTFPGSVVGTMRWFAAPALILNPLIDVVEQAMAPSPRWPL